LDLANAMKNLFTNYFNLLKDSTHPNEVSHFFSLIEEYILAELIEPDAYGGIIQLAEDKYFVTLQAEPSEAVYSVKCSIVSLITTILIIFLNKEVATKELEVFKNMILYLLKDLFSDYEDPDMVSLSIFRGMMITFFNRFIIVNANIIFGLLKENGLSFREFIKYYTGNMKVVSSKSALRLCAIAILTTLPSLNDMDAIQNSINDFLIVAIKKVLEYVETGGQPPQTEMNKLTVDGRIKDFRPSERKRELKESQLYYNANLKEMFQKAITAFCENNKIDLQQLGNLKIDQEVYNYTLDLMKN